MWQGVALADGFGELQVKVIVGMLGEAWGTREFVTGSGGPEVA